MTWGARPPIKSQIFGPDMRAEAPSSRAKRSQRRSGRANFSRSARFGPVAVCSLFRSVSCLVAKGALRLSCAPLAFTIPVKAAERSSRAISLPQALQRTLAANPRLTAAERDIGIAGGLRIQMCFLIRTFRSRSTTRWGRGPIRAYVRLKPTCNSANWSNWAASGRRIAAGEAGIGAAVRRRGLEVLSETAIAFISIISLQRRIEIFDGQIASFDPLIPLLQKRVHEGASSPAETLRAQVAADLFRASANNFPRRARTSQNPVSLGSP